jgi:multidrug efflux pump subunit AcrA (membrane-fusion protein)
MKTKLVPILLISALILSACAGGRRDGPPELIAPQSEIVDTARVTRGPIAQVEQFRGIVRVVSEPLFFLDTNLNFLEFTVLHGQRVNEGDVLARLDTKPWDDQIDSLRRTIADMQTDHAVANEKAEIDITIAYLELERLTRRLTEYGGGYSEHLLMQIENKKIDINRMQVALRDEITRQGMTLTSVRDSLNAVLARLPLAELHAPFDGTVTLLQGFEPGSFVPGYRTVLYLTDGDDMYVEYLNTRERLVVSSEKTMLGIVNGREVGLERRPINRQEAAVIRNAASPLNTWPGVVRFNVTGYDMPLVPGEFVYLYAMANRRDDALRVPANAMYFDMENGDYVYRNENGRRVLVPVTTGISTTVYVEIIYGLSEGDEVFVRS